MLSMSLTGFGYTNIFSKLFSEIESGSKTVTSTCVLASTQVEVTVFDPLSISENNFENMFVYPNPVKDILNIQNVYSNSTTSLFDILGKNYEINVINDFENNRLSLNMSNLETGIYFIRIQDINTGQLKTLRLIKQ